MKLFGKKKSCCCGSCSSDDLAQVKVETSNGIKVLGSGCKKCNELEANVKKALETLNMHDKIDHVTDFAQIAAYGVMTTPALVIDNKVVAYGKVLSVEQAIEIIKKNRK